jgi:hypothetical protein
MGLPHSTTLARIPKRRYFRQVLQWGRPMPLLLLQSVIAFPFVGHMLLFLGVWILLTSAASWRISPQSTSPAPDVA